MVVGILSGLVEPFAAAAVTPAPGPHIRRHKADDYGRDRTHEIGGPPAVMVRAGDDSGNAQPQADGGKVTVT